MKNSESSVFVTVCVSCGEESELLEQNLKALSRQNLDKSLWEMALFFRGEKAPFFVKKLLSDLELTAKIFIQARSYPIHDLRNQAFQQITSPVLFFIDEDVILKNPDHLGALVRLHKQHPETTVLGGGYLSPAECSFWGRAYNWVSRLWMEVNPGVLPAGNLSVKTRHLEPACRFKSLLKGGFGGEEIYFLNQIKLLGRQSLRKTELDAPHLARHTFARFLSRAILHGRNRAFQSSKGSFRKSVFCFIKQPESFSVKIVGGFYLSIVWVVSLVYKPFSSRDAL